MKSELKVLDCQYCHQIFPINEMFTVDACCEEHQEMLKAIPLWGECPEIKRNNTFFFVEHESRFGLFRLKGIYNSCKDAVREWNNFAVSDKKGMQ